MGRRKRIPYDPPHLRSGRKRRFGMGSGPAPRPEQALLTRRMLLGRGAIVAAFSVLAARLGYMQVLKGERYRSEAIQNIRQPEVLKPTRGLVYDRKNRELAVNRETWEVRVLPQELPDPQHAATERRRVLDQIINALSLPDALILDPRDVPEGAHQTVYLRTAQLLGKTLTVEQTDQTVLHPFFRVPGQVVRVNGQDLQVFVYPDATARKSDSARISADGRLIAGEAVAWPVPPRFASAGNVLTVLLSSDTRLAGRVERAIGAVGDQSTMDTVVKALGEDALRAWTDYIETEMRQNFLVRLEDDLTTDQAALCRAHLNEVPGVKVMNRLDYLVENGRYLERIVVKTGVPRETALKLEANRLYLPGVELEDGVLIRRYPGGEAMSHILGYVGQVSQRDLDNPRNQDELGYPVYDPNDAIGKDGLELELEPFLRGTRGRRIVEMDASGSSWRVVPDSTIEPVAGQNVALTIDLELQRAAGEILRAGIAYSNADRYAIQAADPTRRVKKESGAGAVVAIDPRTGEVLAMVTFPHYDNQLFVDGISQRKYQEYTSEEANRPLLDRALRGIYPPGSTLKPFLAAAALHEGTLNTSKTYTCTGAIQVPYAWDESKGNTHPCWAWQLGGHQALDIYNAIEQSCDVFFYNVGAPRQPIDESKSEYLHYRDKNVAANTLGEKHYFEGLGIERIKENLAGRFWFGKATGIELPTEADGVVPDPEWRARMFQGAGWSVGDTINVSIGQGDFLTTPLQLALNTAAIANDGKILKPQLVRETFNGRPPAESRVEPIVQREVGIRKEHMDVSREGMRRVVHGPTGTARSGGGLQTKWPLTNPPDDEQVIIAGKTGTAEIGVPDENGLYERQHAWFTLYAPYDDPEIAITVIVEDGGEGSAYAVPVADRVLRAYFELTGRRPRGLVMRQDAELARTDQSVLADSAVFPEPGDYGQFIPIAAD
ncbi:MAG: penicillin-binding transpeptidase domain-containing protein [Thermomicrobiales bacterium]